MKIRTNSVIIPLLLILAAGLFSACAAPLPEGTGQIYLYGELHSMEAHCEKELELWSDYYHKNGMRHLFIEYPYYYTEYLNLWMKDDDDEILDALYQDIEGTVAHCPLTLDFLRRIKQECPETVFHGTDVGHQYHTTGKRFLAYLESAGQADTEQYRLALECVEQGWYFYENADHVYRENMLAENFIREMDGLGNADIMGIYGGGHVEADGMDYVNGSVSCMSNQLHEKYGEDLHTQFISTVVEPLRTDTITVKGKDYTAQYFGKRYMSQNTSYDYVEFWRLEDAWEDFQAYPSTIYSHYYYTTFFPMTVEQGQVLVLEYTKPDGVVTREYHRADSIRQ